MKKVNFNVSFTDLITGLPMTQEIEDKNGNKETREIKMKNLLANRIGSKTHESDFEKTLLRFELASKIVKAEGEIQLKLEEIEIIKENLTDLPVALAGPILKLIK